MAAASAATIGLYPYMKAKAGEYSSDRMTRLMEQNYDYSGLATQVMNFSYEIWHQQKQEEEGRVLTYSQTFLPGLEEKIRRARAEEYGFTDDRGVTYSQAGSSTGTSDEVDGAGPGASGADGSEDGAGAVSYTHLDVYKRQDLDKAGESAEYIGKNGVFIRFESGDKEAVLKTLRNGLFVAGCKVVADSEPEDSLHGGSGSGLGPASGNRKAGGEKDRPEMVSDDFMEVRIERLDQLQNQAAQLLLQMQILENELSKSGLEDVENGTGHQISLLVSQIERSVMEMRLVPVAKVVPKLKRALRDMCRDQKKEAELVVQCADVEADKSVVDYVSEALLHMVRNAMDLSLIHI